MKEKHCWTYKIAVFSGEMKASKNYSTSKKLKPSSNPTSYKLISLLSGSSKIFEKVLKVKLQIFLQEKYILPFFQLGFRGEPQYLALNIKDLQNRTT